jgi:hypothetical protein
MTLQARMSQDDPRFYNPNRDVAHCFAEVARETAARLEDERWEVIHKLGEQHQITQEDLGLACKAFCEFVTADFRKGESMLACLERVGWFEVKPEAQLFYLGVLGTVVAGVFFAGVREATLGGVGPLLSCQDLRQRGAECARAMTMPRWRRRLAGVRRRLRGAWAALRGKDQ